MTTWPNTCFRCNRYKGPNLTSIDHESGAITALFHPRVDRWAQHFQWRDAVIAPITDIGRATETLLRFNDPERVALRANLIRRGHYPFRERAAE